MMYVYDIVVTGLIKSYIIVLIFFCAEIMTHFLETKLVV